MYAQPAKPAAQATAKLGSDTPAAGGPGLLGRAKSFLGSVDQNKASELARALYVRDANSRVDTRVERPMLDVPTEVPVPVRGNLLAGAAFNKQADNLVTSANQFKTSDGMLHTAANLQANAQAAGLRTQGDLANVESLERTRAASLENEMKNAQIRNQVAGQNTQTLARAAQAERAANNRLNH